MDAQYNEYVSQTELMSIWKDGLWKGLITGSVLGAGIIGLIGMSVCPKV